MRGDRTSHFTLDPAFWAGRKVFLTGHTGFKGTWLTACLLQLGAVVRGYALAPDPAGTPPGMKPFFDEVGLLGQIDHVEGDVRDSGVLHKALRDFSPDIVLHLAAQPLVRQSYEQPQVTFATNVMGTVHLLDACRSLSDLRAVVIVTSDKCYENREQIWAYRETDPMGGHDPYSSSKGCAELVTGAFRSSYFPPDRVAEHGVCVLSVRAGNVLGGGDWSPERLVPDAMRALIAGQELVVRRPDAVRPWQHVLDPVIAYLGISERACSDPFAMARSWNFGPDAESFLSVRTLLEDLAIQSGRRLRWKVESQHEPLHEATMLRLDSALARDVLGWRPLFTINETIAETVAWYLSPNTETRLQQMDRQIKAAILSKRAQRTSVLTGPSAISDQAHA